MINFIKNLWIGLTYTHGEFSSTKFFSSVAYGISSWIIIHSELKSTLSTDFFALYLGVVAGHNVLLRTFAKNPKEQ